ncbi:hypothetical protein DZA51_01535 [Vibrio campbellii]|jgi:hypothetical protein|nr:hypothetical protein DZA51_01535 [Vibrio campbellii]
MEIYSDIEFKPEVARLPIIIVFFCLAPFQVGLIIASGSSHSVLICSFSLFLMCIFPTIFLSKKGFKLLNKRVESVFYGLLYVFLSIAMFIANFVVVGSNELFDINFIMYSFLVFSMIFGFISGFYFSENSKIINDKKNINIRGNEVELRKVDIFGVLSLRKMPFLRAPLKKMRNAVYIVALFIGTGGAGVGMGIAELLKRSDIISPEVGVHSVLFFSLGMPVLFTFGVLIYSMVAYLLEWRKLIAGIEKEFGGHKIIFNSQKKSYKKIKEILGSKE